jgi:phenylacetate-coenzyme A ligase PaaK-like adenylate-forming protein
MNRVSDLEQLVWDSSLSFVEKALAVFRYQVRQIPVYKDWVAARGVIAERVQRIEDIPFLPISFFRTHPVYVEGVQPELVFESSGTTGTAVSRHHVISADWYRQCLMLGFRQAYGDPADYHIAALLPSYLKQQHSSLVFMANELMIHSATSTPYFFRQNVAELQTLLQQWEQERRKVLLLGVTYALLDFAEGYRFSPDSSVVLMETGGMKGRRKEMIREEVHAVLKAKLGLSAIHSEYGMTEMMSQAYSQQAGLYKPGPVMQVGCGDPADPGGVQFTPSTGQLYVIDLGNLYSCSFLQTDDYGKIYAGGQFEVLGRLQGSITRGCNLMADGIRE